MQAEHIYKALDEGATVLTANNRLARFYKAGYNRRKQAEGLRVWPTANLMPFSSWLQQLLTDLQSRQLSSVVLLTQSQQQYVWQEILTQSADGYPLLNRAATARSVQQAWKICCGWRFCDAEYSAPLSPDQKQFRVWSGQYQSYCARHGMIDDAMLAGYLANTEILSGLTLPQRIILAGFYEMSPQQELLLESLSQSIDKVEIYHQERHTEGKLRRISPPDDKSEMQMAARWARRKLGSDPNLRLAVIVPDLQARRSDAEYYFSRCFSPSLRRESLSVRNKPWNISYGLPLANVPVARIALLLCKLVVHGISNEELTELLLSPYIVRGDTELDLRAALDVSPRIRKHLHTGLNELRDICGDKVPGLHRALRVMSKVKLTPAKSPSEWSRQFIKILEAAGWPGEGVLDSAEFQQVEAVREQIAGFAQLDRVSPNMPVREAVTSLQHNFVQTLFQAHTPDAPIQILGLLESTGLSFDAIWVCSMDNEKWPQTESANPFLPIAWQRQVGAPHASAEREFQYSQHLLAQIGYAAESVIFSHVAMRNESPLYCTQALSGLEQIPAAEFMPDSPPLGENEFQLLEDANGPPLAEGEAIAGGSKLLTDQSACPFRAFANFRLSVSEIERAEMGIDARDRGNLMHKILELFWRDVRRQEQLLSLTDGQLRQRIDDIAGELMKSLDYSGRLYRLENDRLVRIVLQWLDLEKRRKAFVVESLEQKRALIFDGIRIQLTVDRIDRVIGKGDTESRVIIDYKTGADHKPGGWMELRPDEPQLPLYAITDEQDVSAVSYAILTQKEQKFSGFSDTEELLPGAGLPKRRKEGSERQLETVDWQQALDGWRKNITALTSEIRQGVASVSPKPRACLWCQIKPFCRIGDIPEPER